jgi:hypothetical protein
MFFEGSHVKKPCETVMLKEMFAFFSQKKPIGGNQETFKGPIYGVDSIGVPKSLFSANHSQNPFTIRSRPIKSKKGAIFRQRFSGEEKKMIAVALSVHS